MENGVDSGCSRRWLLPVFARRHLHLSLPERSSSLRNKTNVEWSLVVAFASVAGADRCGATCSDACKPVPETNVIQRLGYCANWVCMCVCMLVHMSTSFIACTCMARSHPAMLLWLLQGETRTRHMIQMQHGLRCIFLAGVHVLTWTLQDP